jgi:hypothetical protein
MAVTHFSAKIWVEQVFTAAARTKPYVGLPHSVRALVQWRQLTQLRNLQWHCVLVRRSMCSNLTVVGDELWCAYDAVKLTMLPPRHASWVVRQHRWAVAAPAGDQPGVAYVSKADHA